MVLLKIPRPSPIMNCNRQLRARISLFLSTTTSVQQQGSIKSKYKS